MIVGVIGIIALVIGIRRSKVRLWVSAIFILLIAMIFGTAGVYIGVDNFIDKPYSHGESNYHSWNRNKPEEQGDQSFSDDLPEEAYTVKATALLSDKDGNSELIDVLATKKLNRKGVLIETADLVEDEIEVNDNFVYLNLNFERSFRGFVSLKVFDESKRGLSKSTVEIDIDDSLAIDIAFHLEKDIVLSDAAYCTLSIQNY